MPSTFCPSEYLSAILEEKEGGWTVCSLPFVLILVSYFMIVLASHNICKLDVQGEIKGVETCDNMMRQGVSHCLSFGDFSLISNGVTKS